MKNLALLSALPLLALAACGEEPAPAPEPTETAAPEPVATLPPTDEALLKDVFDTTCQGAESISTSVCKRAMGADTATCEFGVGEDTELRHELTLAANEAGDGWMIQDAEAVCAEHGGHHVDQ